MVAGAAAVLASRYPSATPEQLKKQLMSTATAALSTQNASGRLNLQAAVTAPIAAAPVLPTATVSVTSSGTSKVMRYNAPSGVANEVAAWQLGAGGSIFLTDERVELLAGPGCFAVTATRGVACSGVTTLVISTLDQKDLVFADVAVNVSVDTGSGPGSVDRSG